MKSAAAALSLFAAAVAVSGCQSKSAGTVVPVVMAPYAVAPVTVGPTGQGANNGRAGASGVTQATPVAATSMNPAYAQPRPTTTPITAYNLVNMPIAATPVVTMPTMTAAPAPVAVAAPAPQMMSSQTAQQATPVMMMMPAPGQAAPAGGQVMMMMVPAQTTAQQAQQAQPVVAAPAHAPAPVMAQPVQLMNMPTYGAPVYVMPSAR